MAKTPLAKLKPAATSGLADVEAHNLAQPGDLVADECGACFVPFARAAEVLAIAQGLAASERARLEKLAAGIPLSEYAKLLR